MSEKKPLSVEEILAACRGQGTGGAAPKKPAEAAPSEPAGEAADVAPAAPAKPAAAKPPAAAAKPGQMSVADILAAARGQGGGAAQPAAAKPAAEKPAAKPAAAKTPAKPAAEKKTAADKAPAKPALDTSSILAAARGGAKPGPISKAEAAASAKPVAAKAAVAVPTMPAKPAYAQPVPAAKVAAAPEDTRRGFLSVLFGSFLAIGMTSLSLIGLLWTLGLARFFFPNVLIEPPSQFKVGFPSNFAPDTVDERFKAQFGIWVTNVKYEGQQMIVALKTVCTHLGCTPNWLEAEQKFKCPCHGSGFYKDGINFEGPAPRPLERYAIRLSDDGQLEVDKSRVFQQEMGQWNDPQSFVPV